jgi:hypothetical protein
MARTNPVEGGVAQYTDALHAEGNDRHAPIHLHCWRAVTAMLAWTVCLRHQTNKRLAAGLGSTTHPGCTRGPGYAGSILLRSHHSPCPSPPCTASDSQSPSASPCAVRGLPRACACTRAMACGWGVIYVVRSCASNPVCVAPMRMHMHVYDICSQSDSGFLFVFCLFVCFRCASETLLEVAVGQ